MGKKTRSVKYDLLEKQKKSQISAKYLIYTGMITTILYVIVIPVYDIAYKLADIYSRHAWAQKYSINSTDLYYLFYIPLIVFALLWAAGKFWQMKLERGDNWRLEAVGAVLIILIGNILAYYFLSIFFGIHYRLMS